MGSRLKVAPALGKPCECSGKGRASPEPPFGYDGAIASVMNSTSSSLLAKALAAVLGFGLMAAVPLLTMQYVARAHAAAPTVAAAPASCPAGAAEPGAKN